MLPVHVLSACIHTTHIYIYPYLYIYISIQTDRQIDVCKIFQTISLRVNAERVP